MNQVEDADVEVHRKGIHKQLPPPLSAQVESDPCGPCSPCCRAPSQRKLESSDPLRRIIHDIPDAATQRGRKQSGGGRKKERGGEGRKGEKVKEGEGKGQDGKGGGGQRGHAGISQTV